MSSSFFVHSFILVLIMDENVLSFLSHLYYTRFIFLSVIFPFLDSFHVRILLSNVTSMYTKNEVYLYTLFPCNYPDRLFVLSYFMFLISFLNGYLVFLLSTE